MKLLRSSLLALLALFITISTSAQPALQSPSEYLGYEPGEQWTPHYKVIGYFRQVAGASPMVEWQQYGVTNEGRELIVVFVSSEQNIKRREQLRTNNLKRAGLMEGEPAGDKTAIVWLSYNVHGNETSSSEAAMKTLYELVRPGNKESKMWLQNTMVIMDPMLNPDGRDRYVHWFDQTVGDEMNVHPDAREHHEPWPGGRTNHYYFDLNRDWAWLTQKESRQRIDIYQSWLPHIHVDFHEQGYNEPYYFAPAAEPFHKAITDWQRQFQYTIGKNHAHYFDQNNWLYFTREVFDLFYPSYGDTYPIFNGSIGMTYEQAGHSRAGLGVIQTEGDTLTLNDRLTHHFTTGMSTVEITSKNAAKVVDEFAAYYQKGLENPVGIYKTYVIKADNNPDKIRALFKLLDQHKIRYGKAPRSGDYSGYDYNTGKTGRVDVSMNDYIISVYQPKSILVRVFFEPQPELVDSLTYDITAWEQHYAFGLDGFALTDRINPVQAGPPATQVDNSAEGKPYAYLAEWSTMADMKLLAQLLNNDIKVRYARKKFIIDGKTYKPGTLIITRNGNKNLGDRFDRIVRETATQLHQQLHAVETGFVDSGPDFGSDAVHYLEKPRVALLSGSGTSPGIVGEIWHFFDRQIDYPVTMIDTDYFEDVNLSRYDVLILPGGSYNDVLKTERLKEIKEWISSGGRLIAVQGANSFLEGKDGFNLKQKEEAKDEDEADSSDYLTGFNERQRKRISESNPGSVFKITMDNTHPLGYGYDDTYFSLKLNSNAFGYLEKGWNVGVARGDAVMSGFVGYKARKKLEDTLTFGVQNMGQGAIVYMIDNPLFRAFWHNGKLLFGNAVFIVGQ